MNLDRENPEYAGYFCDMHTKPEMPNFEDWDGSLEEFWDYIRNLFPGHNSDKDNDQGNVGNNGNNGNNKHNANKNGNNKGNGENNGNQDEFAPSEEQAGE